MFYYLIHGNLVQAARHHLAALVGLLYGLYALVAWTGGWLFGKRLPLWRPSPRTVAIYVAAFLLYAVVLRNLPWAPFDFDWFYVADPTLGR
jgi:drug/metabolite transporter (DMT)-like permease